MHSMRNNKTNNTIGNILVFFFSFTLSPSLLKKIHLNFTKWLRKKQAREIYLKEG